MKKKKDRGVALKADVEGESDRNSESELSDQEMDFLARRFRKYMKSKNYLPRRRKTVRKKSSKELGREGRKKVPICFECNKFGHYRSDCPHLKE